MESKGLPVYMKDATLAETYRQLKLSPGNYVVVMTGDDEKNLKICEMLRQELHHERIISRPGGLKIENHLRQLGVEILDARRVLASTIENLILRPTTYHALVESFENYVVEDIIVTNPEIDGKAVKDIPFEKDAMLILLTRGSEKNIPHGDSYLRRGDVITVFGTDSAIQAIHRIVRKI
jgi:Trk K+ transport system NAD-binding subunit